MTGDIMGTCKNAIIQWLLVLLAFGIFGSVIGYGLAFGWIIIWGLVLGHGDAGPEWVNTLSNCLLISGFIISYAVGFIYLASRKRKMMR